MSAKGKASAWLIVTTILVGVAYNRVCSSHRTTLSQTATRIAEASRHIEQGRLEAADSLLFQVDADLTTIEWWYTLPSIKREAAVLRHEAGEARDRLVRRNKATDEWLQGILALVSQGEFGWAKAAIVSEQAPLAESDPKRRGLIRFVDRLAVQDFAGAEKALWDVAGGSAAGSMLPGLQRLVSEGRATNRESQATLAHNVKQLIDDASFKPGLQLALRGRAMIWDFTKDDVEKAYELLPDDLRASSRDGLITIFCITERRNVEVGRYSISNQQGYREYMRIAVVYWPAMVCAGVTEIAGSSPATVREVTYSPEYGSSVEIKKWIESLPRHEWADEQAAATNGEAEAEAPSITPALQEVTEASRAESRRAAQAVRSTIREVAGLLSRGSIKQASDTLEKVIATLSKPEPALGALTNFVNRLAFQDFTGAEKVLEGFPRRLPDESGLGEEVLELRRLASEGRAANRKAQASMAQRVKRLVEAGGIGMRMPLVLRGRAMVWDFTKDDVEKAYELLPDDLRASSRDGLITIFCITERRNVEVGTYSISGQPGYQEHMQIGVVYWPAGVYAGSTEITGGRPRSVREVRGTPEYGSSVAIKEWIEQLPRIEQRPQGKSAAKKNAPTRSMSPSVKEPKKAVDPTAMEKSLLKMGIALEKMGKAELALDYYRRVVSEHPDTPEAREAEARSDALKQKD